VIAFDIDIKKGLQPSRSLTLRKGGVALWTTLRLRSFLFTRYQKRLELEQSFAWSWPGQRQADAAGSAGNYESAGGEGHRGLNEGSPRKTLVNNFMSDHRT